MKLQSLSLLLAVALAACNSVPTPSIDTETKTKNTLHGLLYVQPNKTAAASPAEPHDVILLNAEGQKNILGVISVHRAFDSAFQLFQNSVYYIASSGGIEAFDLDSHQTKTVSLNDVTTLNPVNDFIIAPDGAIYVLQGTCGQEAEPYDCNLYAYSMQTGVGNFLHKMEPVSLWGGASLESADNGKVLYKIHLNEGGNFEYYRFNVNDKKSVKIYEKNCGYDLGDDKPCDEIVHETGFSPPQKNFPSTCAGITIDSSDPRSLAITTNAGRLDHYLGAERLLACFDN